jgi:hypothetical protein
MKQISSVALISALAIALLAGNAHAGSFYDPPPPLMGQPSYHLYSVPGVIESGWVNTFFACTNTTGASIRVGIEVFGYPGGAAVNDPSALSLDIAPGGMRLFGTTGTTNWVVVDIDLATGGMSRGSARILATKRSGIICTAFLADPGNDPPTSMADLKVVKKTTQKGE